MVVVVTLQSARVDIIFVVSAAPWDTRTLLAFTTAKLGSSSRSSQLTAQTWRESAGHPMTGVYVHTLRLSTWLLNTTVNAATVYWPYVITLCSTSCWCMLLMASSKSATRCSCRRLAQELWSRLTLTDRVCVLCRHTRWASVSRLSPGPTMPNSLPWAALMKRWGLLLLPQRLDRLLCWLPCVWCPALDTCM